MSGGVRDLAPGAGRNEKQQQQDQGEHARNRHCNNTTRGAGFPVQLDKSPLETVVALSPGSALAIYPGSFDPITYGHLDLIERGSRLFGRLVVSILRNDKKQPLFDVEERMEMLREAVAGYPNVEVDSFHGLLVDYAARRGATAILRGIRAVSDYEYELQMALMNRRLQPDIETVFLLAGEAYSFISSRLVKEICGLGGNISGLVPPGVEARLRERAARDKA
ncbi:MAG: pantetheine-phosphate adenylyltransferase [Bryobacterales bacterium]|nr:pantetheine-phosphate adenylyltransferase [Bryobacterales bacterium]